jgi:hypothetical protein
MKNSLVDKFLDSQDLQLDCTTASYHRVRPKSADIGRWGLGMHHILAVHAIRFWVCSGRVSDHGKFGRTS